MRMRLFGGCSKWQKLQATPFAHVLVAWYAKRQGLQVPCTCPTEPMEVNIPLSSTGTHCKKRSLPAASAPALFEKLVLGTSKADDHVAVPKLDDKWLRNEPQPSEAESPSGVTGVAVDSDCEAASSSRITPSSNLALELMGKCNAFGFFARRGLYVKAHNALSSRSQAPVGGGAEAARRLKLTSDGNWTPRKVWCTVSSPGLASKRPSGPRRRINGVYAARQRN